MDREIALDKFLKHICETPRSFWTCSEYLKVHLNIDDYNLSTSIANEIVERDWAKPAKYDNNTMMVTYEGQQIIEKYGSYSSFLRSAKKLQSKKTIAATAKTVIPMGIAIGSILVNIYFGWLNYSDGKKIDNLETEIENLTHINDSLILQNDTTRKL